MIKIYVKNLTKKEKVQKVNNKNTFIDLKINSIKQLDKSKIYNSIYKDNYDIKKYDDSLVHNKFKCNFFINCRYKF